MIHKLNTFRTGITVLLGLTLLLGWSTSHATDFCVSDATKLQKALTEAAYNEQDDTIQIVQGDYVGNFVYASTKAHNLTITGGYTTNCASRVEYPTNTVLDGDKTQTVLILNSDQEVEFLVNGITLQNGKRSSDSYAGGLSINASQGTITLSNNIIDGNSSEGSYAGGLYISTNLVVTLTDNTIVNNSGTGVSISHSSSNSYFSAIFTDNTINNNHNDGGSGGGIYVYYYKGQSTFTGNTIKGNSASKGGGVFLYSRYDYTATFKNNIIDGNTADENGGGIYTYNRCDKIVFTNNVIINNTTDGNGGGVNSYCNQVSLTNNIISGNTAAQGGGLWLNIPASITNLYNNIIWNNTATSGSDLCVLNGTSVPSTINMHNNNFDHSAAGFVSTLPYYIKPSNLDNVDPLFVDANNGNYQLQAGSSMIDAGENEAPEIPSTDKDDNPRVMSGVVDIGAYEYQWQSTDSSQVEFSAANYSVNENDGSITINVARTGGREGVVSVRYVTADGSAKAGTDYTAASGTLSWADGDMAVKTFTVKIINDNVAGTNKTVNLQLKNVTGEAIIGSQSSAVLTIEDTGNQCNYVIAPLSRTHNDNADTGNVTVTAPVNCPWTATSNNTGWLKITSANSGNSNGTVSYSVTEQTSPDSRTGTLTIAEKTFTVIQNGINCTYRITPTTRSHSANTENETLNVTARDGCAWTAASSAAWIQITSGDTGQGNGTVKYTVTANTSTKDRQGTITVADNQTVTLTQKGLDCSYSVSPTSRYHTAESETGEVVVTAARGCPWTASSNISWANITISGTGQGQGSVTYAVMANSDSQSRSGTLTIAGQPVTLTQAPYKPVTTRLINLSTRAPIEGGLGDLIAGFIITGSGTQKVFLRGFRLEAGVNPKLLVQKFPSGEVVAENDNWQDDSRASEVETLPSHLQLSNATDAGLLLDLPAGAYTATLSSVGSTGLGLIGVDEVEQSSTAKLTNLSTRASIRGGANDIIAGFIITGADKQKVWLRGFGIDAGVDPKIQVQTFPDAADVAINNNWQTNSNANDIAALPTHLQLGKTTDAGLLLELPVGAYTVILSSVGAKGLGLIGVDAVE